MKVWIIMTIIVCIIVAVAGRKLPPALEAAMEVQRAEIVSRPQSEWTEQDKANMAYLNQVLPKEK